MPRVGKFNLNYYPVVYFLLSHAKRKCLLVEDLHIRYVKEILQFD